MEFQEIENFKNTKRKKWYSLSSPVGFVIFINGIVLFPILVRYLFIMN